MNWADSRKLGIPATPVPTGATGLQEPPEHVVDVCLESSTPILRHNRSVSRIQNIEDSGDSVSAQVSRPRTVVLVAKYQPPPSTRVGHLHAAGAVPPRPVGEIPIDTSPDTSTRSSPLRSIGLPKPILAPELVVTRILDCAHLGVNQWHLDSIWPRYQRVVHRQLEVDR